MRIEKLLAILALGAMVSCQTKDNLDPVSLSPADQEQTVLAERSPNTPLTYLADVDHDAWASLESLEERIEACNPSQEVLSRMSTEALVESVAHYPLNFLVSAYNDPEEFIRILNEKSTIHQELRKRQDGAGSMVDFLAETKLRMDVDAGTRLKHKDLDLGEELFLEHFAATEEFQRALSSEESRKLESVAKSKLIERMAEPEVFSRLSLEPLKKMAATPVLTPETGIAEPEAFLRYNTVYTPLGHMITTLVNSEMSQDEINYFTNYYARAFRNAQVVSPASTRYNCHSYAWYSRSTSNPHWINAGKGNKFQLSRYWTDDVYVSCTESQAEIVYYANGDHSAVRRSDGKYISKWGFGPVMIHTAAHCPYESSGRQYYKVSPYAPIMGLELRGPSTPAIGQEVSYYVDRYNPSVNYHWTVDSYPSGPNPTAPTIIGGTNNSSISIRFNSTGYYRLRVDTSGSKPDGTTFNIGYGMINAVPLPY